MKDNEELTMLGIPRKFMEVMNEWLVIKRLLRVVRLSANKRCAVWVEVQNFEGHMVLGRGWNYFCRRHRIVPRDLVVVRISGLGLEVQVYNHDSLVMCRYRCSKHNCLGGIEQAM